jgi:AraC family transcriptional regulator of adaptative response/methylated-DNA-[protein]-cysteine methyltransferase
MPDHEIMYQALLNKDSSFEGIFFAAIKTTSIFCRPTCRARKPKRENVEFFTTAREALFAGYRPCRICSPMEPPGQVPDAVLEILRTIGKEPGERWKNADLKQKGIHPDFLRRWFKKHHGITFQAYLRALRVGQAFERIKEGENVLDTAMDHGYDSLSGFTEAFKRNIGASPQKSLERTIISITRIATPLGPMLAGATGDGICLLEFADRRMVETQVTRLEKHLHARAIPGRSPLFEQLEIELGEYFEGHRKTFTIPTVLPGTPFQKKVWEILREIPYGTTRSYTEQAALIGNPGAVRAVAKANGDNRIAILIPCHRVIGVDGRPVGYGGGIGRKEYLLKLERTHCNA